MGELGQPLRVLHEDDALVAVYKPAGMLVHRTKLAAAERVFALQTVRNQTGRRVYPVHRLDKPTAGVLLFAFDAAAARDLAAQFEAHTIVKHYMAVVRGFSEGEGVVEKPLRPLWDRTTDPEAARAKPPQPAHTVYRTLGRCELPVPTGRYATSRYSLVHLMPVSGRQHQIRRHLNHIAHPIIGDAKHGDYRHNRYFTERFGRRLLLVAVQLELTHPRTGRPLVVTATIDEEFQAVLSALGVLDAVPAPWRQAPESEL